MASTRIDDAQISDDGQWVLFTVFAAGQAQLRVVRTDGQGMQTLHCAAPGSHISNAQWSIDQKWVVFDEGPATGGARIHLLHMARGSLPTKPVPPPARLAHKHP